MDTTTTLPSNGPQNLPSFNPPQNPQRALIQFGLTPPFELILLADYCAEKGDNRLKDALKAKVEKLISDPNFSLEQFINAASFDPEELFTQAEKELAAVTAINDKITQALQDR